MQFEVLEVFQCDNVAKCLVEVDGAVAALTVRRPTLPSNLQGLLDRVESVETAVQNDMYTTLHGYFSYMPRYPDLLLTLKMEPSKGEIDAMRPQTLLNVSETPDIYGKITHPFIMGRLSRNAWVYNILDGLAEQETLVFRDADPENGFIIARDMKFDGSKPEELYMQAICNRRDIYSIRDLGPTHLPLLRAMRQKAIETVRAVYPQVPCHELMCAFHYQPSFYHLHLHIFRPSPSYKAEVNVFSRWHHVDDVIANIELVGDYYQRRTLLYPLGDEHELAALLRANDPSHKFLWGSV